MKLGILSWLAILVALGMGCIQSHHYPVVYGPVPASTVVAPPAGRVAQRVYPENAPPVIQEAPSAPGTAVITQAPVAASGPIVAGRDLATADAVRRLFETDPSLATTARNVQITVEDERLVLRGTVASKADRQELQSRLARLPGVRSVNNRLEVALP